MLLCILSVLIADVRHIWHAMAICYICLVYLVEIKNTWGMNACYWSWLIWNRRKMKLLLYIFFGSDGFYEWKVTAVLDFLYYTTICQKRWEAKFKYDFFSIIILDIKQLKICFSKNSRKQLSCQKNKTKLFHLHHTFF